MSIETLESGRTPAKALADAATHAKTLAGDALQSVSQAIEQGRAKSAAQFDAGREAVVGYVREKPFTSIGVAALAGILLGLLVFHAHRDSSGTADI